MDPGDKEKKGEEREAPSQLLPDEFVERLRRLGVELLGSLHEDAFLQVHREKQSRILGELAGQAWTLLDMAACFEGRKEGEEEPENVGTEELVSYIRERFQSRAAARDVAFQIHFDTPFPVRVVYRAGNSAKLLSLLLENAFRRTSDGRISLQLGFDREKCAVSFVVNDTGTGLSRERLQEAYNEGRFPMEMLAALEIANRLQGSFEVHSLEGVGTSYRGELPVHHASDDVLLFVPPPVEAPNHKTQKTCLPDPAAIRGSLLVYEHSFLFSEILSSWLQKTSLDVTYARDFESEQNRPLSRQFDMILIDTTGRWEESCRFVRRVRDMGLEVPFMALVLNESVEEAIEEGFDYLVRVPCDQSRFIRILSCLFRKASSAGESSGRHVPDGPPSIAASADVTEGEGDERALEAEKPAAGTRDIERIISETPEAVNVILEFLQGLDSELVDAESFVRGGEIDRAGKEIGDLVDAAEMLELSSIVAAAGRLRSAVLSGGIGEIKEGFIAVQNEARQIREVLVRHAPAACEAVRDADKNGNGRMPREKSPRVGAHSEFSSCINDFLTSLKNDERKLNQYLLDGNWGSLQFLANQLRGTASIYGFEKHAAELLQIETGAKIEDGESVRKALEALAALSDQENTGAAQAFEALIPKITTGNTDGGPEPDPISSELSGSSPELVPLIVEFLGSLDGYLDRITSAANELAWVKLKTVAHELAGVSSMYGYPLCARTAKSLQAAAEASSQGDLDPLISQLRTVTKGMKKGMANPG